MLVYVACGYDFGGLASVLQSSRHRPDDASLVCPQSTTHVAERKCSITLLTCGCKQSGNSASVSGSFLCSICQCVLWAFVHSDRANRRDPTVAISAPATQLPPQRSSLLVLQRLGLRWTWTCAWVNVCVCLCVCIGEVRGGTQDGNLMEELLRLRLRHRKANKLQLGCGGGTLACACFCVCVCTNRSKSDK